MPSANNRLKVRGGRIIRKRGRTFCAECPEMQQLSHRSPNGDQNLERLSHHLSKLNVKGKSKKRNYVKF